MHYRPLQTQLLLILPQHIFPFPINMLFPVDAASCVIWVLLFGACSYRCPAVSCRPAACGGPAAQEEGSRRATRLLVVLAGVRLGSRVSLGCVPFSSLIAYPQRKLMAFLQPGQLSCARQHRLQPGYSLYSCVIAQGLSKHSVPGAVQSWLRSALVGLRYVVGPQRRRDGCDSCPCLSSALCCGLCFHFHKQGTFLPALSFINKTSQRLQAFHSCHGKCKTLRVVLHFCYGVLPVNKTHHLHVTDLLVGRAGCPACHKFCI